MSKFLSASICPFNDDVMNIVRYGCTCGNCLPIYRMYFCRHCFEMRCGFCVSHEVDSHYCPNCLENMPSAEARLKKNRCANCFDCPSCGHTLSTRATSMALPPPADDPTKVTLKKVYYLACAFCRWTSRDIGLPDQNVASGGWPDRENPDAARIANLQEHYRTLAQKEKIEKENKRFMGRKLSYMQLSDKYGLTTVMARKRAGLPPLQSLSIKDGEAAKQVDVAPSVAKTVEESGDGLPEEIFTKLVDLCRTTGLDQRLMQVDTQPEDIKQVYPRHKHLMIKRSQRCRKCEHNLSKPEYNPTSIKFKIQLAAHFHVPEVIVYKFCGEMIPGKESQFMLKITNPTQHATNIEFMSLEKCQALKKSVEEAKEAAKDDQQDKVKAATSLLRQPSLIEASNTHDVATTGRVRIPSGKIYLPPRDDAAEFDDSGPDLKGIQDDKSVVAWRKGNKVGIVMSVVPDDTTEDVVVGFGMKFVYTNTVSALENKEVQTADIMLPVYVNLGNDMKKEA